MHPTSTNQKGAVLFVSLIILLVMTILGVTAMSSTSLEERMASNDRQRLLAMQAAEAALRDAEDWLETNITTIASLNQFNGSNELYSNITSTGCTSIARPGWDIYEQSNWTNANSQAISVDVTGIDSNNQPRYIIEYMGRANASGTASGPLDPTSNTVVCGGDPFSEYTFRITALGRGQEGNATYTLQSFYFIPGPLL